MHDPLDDSLFTPRATDTPVRSQRDRETYRASGKTNRRSSQWKPGDKLGHFQLGALLGQGSSSFVYEAVDLDRNWRCALKILVPETVEDLVRNKVGFRRMLGLKHRNLTRVDQIHRFGETVALSMELIEGQTFAKATLDLRRLDHFAACGRIAELLRQYGAALSVMHTNCLIHRDIKPQNLMVGNDGQGRIVDYGLVGTINPEADPSGVRSYLAGTPQYMAPEVWFDQCYLPAGDVYSLGKVIYETLVLISGTKRLMKENREEFEETCHLHEMINQLGPTVPDFLRDACAEMLETNPGDRPTALELSRVGSSTTSTFMMPSDHRIYGREEELARIFSWLDEVLKGGSGRLHLSGPSGIGKSRILNEVVQRLSSRRWVHVFMATCQYREDQPLQAFDQIADSLATRYAKEDLGVIEIDPGSATIMHQAFPVLRGVVTASHKLPVRGSVPARLDALEAAIRLTTKVLETGPMILIIDDAQWADQDSLNVLDRLQSERAGSLGIITVSRVGDDLQKLPADHHLRVGPLSLDNSIAMLENATRRWNVSVVPSTLVMLAEAAEGSPFRLDELAEEFRPGGAFAGGAAFHGGEATLASMAAINGIDQLWQTRVSRLSESARRALTVIATAGGKVSREELAAFDGGTILKDGSLEELREQRLIQGDAYRDDSIQIVHDRVAIGLVDSLPSLDKNNAHLQWAKILAGFPNQEYQAARIAGHLFEAGDIERGIEYADRAAIDAEQRFALTEAARWHERIVPYEEGPARIQRIRKTAVCYDHADRPVEAAEYYHQLSSLLTESPGHESESLECELRSLALLTRTGQTDQLRRQMLRMATRMGLPKPKPVWLAKAALMSRLIQYKSLKQWRTVFKTQTRCGSTSSSNETLVSGVDDARLRLCLALGRPLSMLDNLYGAEICIAGSLIALSRGSESQKIQIDLGNAVYGCYDDNSQRVSSEVELRRLLARAEQLGDKDTIAEGYSAVSASHMLSARWLELLSPAQQAISLYRESNSPRTFEIVHTQFFLTWALWHLGKFRQLTALSQQLFDQSITRNDRLAGAIGGSGYASAAWLAEHRLSEFDAMRSEIASSTSQRSMQVFIFFESIASLQRMMYENRWVDAKAELVRTRSLDAQLPYRGIQIFRIARLTLASLIEVQLFASKPSRVRERRCLKLIKRLRSEKLSQAIATADLHEGYIHSLSGRVAEAVARFTIAATQAKRQGLTTIHLAALDGIDCVTNGSTANRLEQFLRNEGVVKPEAFANLFSLRPPCSS